MRLDCYNIRQGWTQRGVLRRESSDLQPQQSILLVHRKKLRKTRSRKVVVEMGMVVFKKQSVLSNNQILQYLLPKQQLCLTFIRL